VNPRFLLVIAIASFLAFPALGHAPSSKRKPYVEVEDWACQVNGQYWLKFRVIEGQMYARKQAWPAGMTRENTIQCWGWVNSAETEAMRKRDEP
jgi:hypothetical protein